MRMNLRMRCQQRVFIHESIKTRVETGRLAMTSMTSAGSLSMNPLKQGLKLGTTGHKPVCRDYVFIHESIKTRVETQTGLWAAMTSMSLYP